MHYFLDVLGLNGWQLAFFASMSLGVLVLRATGCELSFRWARWRKLSDAMARRWTRTDCVRSWGVVVSTAGIAACARSLLMPGLGGERVAAQTGLSPTTGGIALVFAGAAIGYVAALFWWASVRAAKPGEEWTAKFPALIAHYLAAFLVLSYGALLSGPVEGVI